MSSSVVLRSPPIPAPPPLPPPPPSPRRALSARGCVARQGCVRLNAPITATSPPPTHLARFVSPRHRRRRPALSARAPRRRARSAQPLQASVLFYFSRQSSAWRRRQCAAGINHVGDCRCRRCSAAATARRRTAAVAPPATARATTRTATLAPTRGAAAAAATAVTTATLAPPAGLAAARGGRPRGARSRGRRRATPRPTSRCRSMGSAGR